MSTDSRFLEGEPPEIRQVLDWYGAEHAQRCPDQGMSEFVGKFLGAMLDDGAVFPLSSAVSPCGESCAGFAASPMRCRRTGRMAQVG